CISCGACQEVCPVSCISEDENGKRVIDEDVCIDCGSCASVCPVSCISHVE
ncbi:MAG: 4Fe-4S binding protein, partial [Cetobacterium sp.]|nr:4Fe-4S binding protein [Cetobacterium sp.]